MQSSETSRDTRLPALIVLCAGLLMIILDGTVVNVALPSIQHDLGFSQSSLAWVVNAYLIAFGGLLLLAGRLGDLVGRERMFLAGLAVFTAASLLCGLASSQEELIAARFIQGVGGAAASAVILGVIVTMFPERGEQARAMGVVGFVASGGASLGLLVGGVLTQSLSWHWIFFVNVGIGIATAAFALRLLPRGRGLGLGAGADVAGAALVTAALMLGVYTIVKTVDHGWTSAHTLGLGAASLALLAAFVTRQRRAANPLLPLRMFRSRTVVVSNLIMLLLVAAMFGQFFHAALYLQRVLGYGAAQTGFAFLPVSLAIGTLSLGFSARLSLRFGARAVLAAALALLAAGLALLTTVPPGADYATQVLPPMLLLGIGGGLAFPTVTTLAMSGATAEDSGLASGLVNTAQQVGGALGLSVLATLATGRTQHLLGAGEGHASALTAGYHLAFGVAALLALAGLALAVAARAPRPAYAG